MPRKARTFSSTGIYHICIRSVNQHIIFEEEFDYQKCLFILSDCKKKFDIDIYAYCLMDNHIHLLLRANNEDLSPFFKSFGARFVMWYNRKYSRVGHLFQNRFLSSAVESEAYYLQTLAYIHHNPVKANVCRYPSEYRWSSYNEFYGKRNPIANISFSYDVAGSKETLLNYFATVDAEKIEMDFDYNEIIETNMTDEQALELIKRITDADNMSELTRLTKIQRNKLVRILASEGLNQTQIARLLDISRRTVCRICENDTEKNVTGGLSPCDKIDLLC